MDDHTHNHDCDCGHDHDDIITLYDEDGNETDFLVVDGVEYNGTMYLALVEEEHADDDECEFVILRADTDGDEDILSTIDDEEEFTEVMKLLDAKLDESDYEIEGVLDDMDFDDDFEPDDEE